METPLPELTAQLDGAHRENARLSQLMMASPVGLGCLDHELRYVFVNGTLARMNGLSIDAHLGRRLPDLFPHLWRVLGDAIGRVLATGEPCVGLELSAPAPTHSTTSGFWIVSCYPVRVAEQSAGVGIVVTDVTARVESEQRFRATFEQAAVGIAHVSKDGRGVRANAKLCTILGYDAAELLTLDFTLLMHPDDRDPCRARLAGLLARPLGSLEATERMRRKDGSDVWTQQTLSLVCQPDGAPNYFIAVIEDITARRAAEARIVALNRLYAVLSATNEAIVRVRDPEALLARACAIAVDHGGFALAFVAWVGADGAIETKGAAGDVAFVEAMPLSAADVAEGRGPTGNAIREGRHDICNDIATDPRMAPWQLAAQTRGYRAAASFPLRAGGVVRGAIALAAREVGYFDAELIRLLDSLADDLSLALQLAAAEEQRKSAEDALRSAERELVNRGRLAAVGRLAATMAHEVRNPLGVLFNSIGTLEKKLPADGDTGTLLAIMREEARRLERLVRELLDFAKPLTPSLASESIGTLVHGAVEAASLEVGPNHARISAEIPPDVPLVRVDASMMRRAFVNLLVNALQAAGATGTVDVHASIQKLEGRRFARVDIIDTGPGITAEIAPRIFDPFFTTKATGTGLGLAVVKSIVESHGGFIDLNSAPGAGTTISISIAVDAEQPAG